MLGSVTKINPGPAPGFIPYAKHAGKIINPAVNATNVSKPVTIKLSPNNDFSLPMYDPKIAIEPIPKLNVKNACPNAAYNVVPNPSETKLLKSGFK